MNGWPTIDLRHVESIDVAPIELPGDLSRILITGSVLSVPTWMEERIVEGGFVIAPIGDHHHQELMKNERQFDALHPTSLGPFHLDQSTLLRANRNHLPLWKLLI